jgi:hypothetical protein
MAKNLIKKIDDCTTLYRCPRTGIAWVENGHLGMSHSAHANIDSSGSIRGMRARGYWKKDCRTVRTNGAIYNIDTLIISDDLDKLAAEHCRCEACNERRSHQ